ncbi:MAG: DUF1294 domain-containing protein [Patescibacteria group bacterium]
MNIETVFLSMLFIYIIINIFSFSLMLSDKKKSRKDEMRISEGALLFAAICFGALGIWAGMYVSRHKTKKMIFVLGVPLALVQNLAVIYLLYLAIVRY